MAINEVAINLYETAPSDGELMAQLATGDAAPLGELYLRHGFAVSQLLTRTMIGTATAEDVEDLCQEVFLTAFRTAPRYEERGKLRSWLFKLALTEARSLGRKRWLRRNLFRRFTAERQILAPVAVNVDESEIGAKKRISQAIAALPQNQREVLMLAVGEGMSGKEISETLGISHNAVRARLHRARTTIQADLKVEPYAEEPGGAL
jgi:RNA polymerase sigma-70 factor (ECF subfamily)